MVDTVVKAKLGDLEEDTREGFIRHLSKELTGVLGRMIFLVIDVNYPLSVTNK